MKKLFLTLALISGISASAQDFDSMTREERIDYVGKALTSLGNGDDSLIDAYRYWHVESNPNNYIVLNKDLTKELFHVKGNLGISSEALITNINTYKSGDDTDWITYEFNDRGKHISITFDKRSKAIITDFRSKKIQ